MYSEFSIISGLQNKTKGHLIRIDNTWIYGYQSNKMGFTSTLYTHLFYFIEGIYNFSFAKIKNGTFNYLGTLF